MSSYTYLNSSNYANAANAVVNETIFNILANNEASFNDGTGISNGAIINHHAYKRNVIETYWGQGNTGGAGAAVIPSGWTTAAGMTANYGQAAIGTYNPFKLQQAAGLVGVAHSSGNYVSSKIMRARFIIAVSNPTDGAYWSCGFQTDATVANMVVAQFTPTNGLRLSCSKAAANSTAAASYTVVNNTFVILTLEYYSGVANLYINDATTAAATITAAANLPVTLLYPAVMQYSAGGAQAAYLAESQIIYDYNG